jgi:hypothetical protein
MRARGFILYLELRSKVVMDNKVRLLVPGSEGVALRAIIFARAFARGLRNSR